MEETRICPFCGETIKAAAKKCKYCKTWLVEYEKTKRCPNCGEEILEIAKKCKYCGEWLDFQSDKEATSSTTTEFEDNVQVTCQENTASNWQYAYQNICEHIRPIFTHKGLRIVALIALLIYIVAAVLVFNNIELKVISAILWVINTIFYVCLFMTILKIKEARISCIGMMLMSIFFAAISPDGFLTFSKGAIDFCSLLSLLSSDSSLLSYCISAYSSTYIISICCMLFAFITAFISAHEKRNIILPFLFAYLYLLISGSFANIIIPSITIGIWGSAIIMFVLSCLACNYSCNLSIKSKWIILILIPIIASVAIYSIF